MEKPSTVIKFQPKVGQSAAFNSTGRNDPAFIKKICGEGRVLSVGPVFLPNRSQIEKSKKELTYMVPFEKLNHPRARRDKSPTCQMLEKDCSFKNRQLI